MMYARPCRLPDNLSCLVHKLNQVFVPNSGCSYHVAAFLVHDSNWGKPMTNTEQTLDRLRHLGPGGRLRASRRSGLGRGLLR